MIGYIIYVREQERDFQQHNKKKTTEWLVPLPISNLSLLFSAERPPHQS